MKKHSAAAGPTGIRRLRSLVTFRHQNPLARLLSIMVAFAIAMLLVAGTGSAYAEDAAPTPDPSATETTAPGDPAVPEDPAPATADPAPADPAPADQPAADSTTSGTSVGTNSVKPESARPSVSTALKTMATGVVPAASGNCDPQNAPVHVIGLFEIDGNTCVDDSGNLDWDTTGLYHFDDAKDDTAYTQGDAENTNPAGWHTGGSSQGKDDITDAWSYTKVVSGDVWTYFGIQRVSDNGTTTYDVELNHNANSPGEQNPDRTVASGTPRAGGDLLLQFSVTGNGPLTFDKAYQWTVKADFDSVDCFEAGTTGFGWCPLNTVTSPAFESNHSDDGLFAEGAINLSALADANGHICTGSFGWMNIRTVASESHSAALQDYVLPFPTNIDSTCGGLTIEKRDETGALVGGATFTISDDPRPGHDGPVTVKDGPGLATAQPGTTAIADPDGSADGDITFTQADPGSYTVTEVSPPSSDYMIDNPLGTDPNPQSTSSGHPVVFHFVDHHIWKPLTITKTADGTFGATYHWTINKLISLTGEDGTWVDGTKLDDPLVKNVESGDNTALYYKLVVTEDGVDTSSYVVKGTIHVGNDNPDTFPDAGAVDATLSESLAGCTLDSTNADFPVDVTVPSGGANYAYTCNLGDTPPADGLKNTASVEWARSYTQTTDDIGAGGNFDPVQFETKDPIVFSETAPVDKTVTITDDTGDLAADWTLTYGVGGPSHESDVYLYDPVPDPGSCSDVITNTATVVGDGDKTATTGEGQDAVDSENGQVCVEDSLTAAVTNVNESLTRTFHWNITKSTTTPPPATITVQNGQAIAHYAVTVEALPYDDSGWAMTGTVQITNPNLFTDKQVSALDIAYAGGGSCTPDNPVLPDIAADSSADVAFTCDFGDPAVQPDYAGDVTATVKWDGDTNSVDADPATVAEADWVITAVDEFVKVFDDHAVPGTQDPLFEGTQLRWQDVSDSEGGAVDVEYDYTYSGSILPAAGSCADLTNTAWLDVVVPEVILGRSALAPEGAYDSADATVRVCTPAVIVSPPVVSPPEVSPPAALPNTGGPDAWLLAAGLVLLLGGSSLVIGDRRRRRRS